MHCLYTLRSLPQYSPAKTWRAESIWPIIQAVMGFGKVLVGFGAPDRAQSGFKGECVLQPELKLGIIYTIKSVQERQLAMKARSGAGSHPRPSNPSLVSRPISRRRFLQTLSAFAVGLLAPGCPPDKPPETPVPTYTPMPTGAPTSTPPSAPTATPTVGPTSTPPATPTPAPTPTPSPQPLSRVAIAQASSYDRQLVRQQVEALLDGLGGLQDLIGPGDRVAIKPNLTGGTGVAPPPGVPAIESYITHPEVVRALGELLRDAGAGQLFIVEGVFDPDSYPVWGYEEVAGQLGATLVDLNAPHPYGDFISMPVGEGWFVYQAYTLNPILSEIDAFVSVAKMKCHWSCGLTLSLKNLIGLVPTNYYRCSPDHAYRSDLHGCDGVFTTRLPRAVIDLARTRPIHLALIDGIRTVEAGEGPWVNTTAPVQPGVLVAGKNPVATDAVSAAVMGFDPTISYPSAPFLRSDNHLSLAHDMGLGTHRLEEIQVVGRSIDEVRYEFRPCWD